MSDLTPTYGPVEAKVRQDVGALISSHPMGEAIAEMSFSLAHQLDAPDLEAKSVAGINRELRANLVELARLAVDAEDDLGADLSAPSDGDG